MFGYGDDLVVDVGGVYFFVYGFFLGVLGGDGVWLVFWV